MSEWKVKQWAVFGNTTQVFYVISGTLLRCNEGMHTNSVSFLGRTAFDLNMCDVLLFDSLSKMKILNMPFLEKRFYGVVKQYD